VIERYGVFRRADGYSERALFVIDAQGVIRHAQVFPIDDLPNNEELRRVIRRIDPIAAAKEPEEFRVKAPLPHGGVVMYCTKWCPDCRRARPWLEEHKIPYTEVDIYSTPGAEDQVRAWCNGNLVTPTFDIDGEIVIDFDRMRLSQILHVVDF